MRCEGFLQGAHWLLDRAPALAHSLKGRLRVLFHPALALVHACTALYPSIHA